MSQAAVDLCQLHVHSCQVHFSDKLTRCTSVSLLKPSLVPTASSQMHLLGALSSSCSRFCHDLIRLDRSTTCITQCCCMQECNCVSSKNPKHRSQTCKALQVLLGYQQSSMWLATVMHMIGQPVSSHSLSGDRHALPVRASYSDQSTTLARMRTALAASLQQQHMVPSSSVTLTGNQQLLM